MAPLYDYWPALVGPCMYAHTYTRLCCYMNAYAHAYTRLCLDQWDLQAIRHTGRTPFIRMLKSGKPDYCRGKGGEYGSESCEHCPAANSGPLQILSMVKACCVDGECLKPSCQAAESASKMICRVEAGTHIGTF
jgi:hypothetical protein